eukprot:g4291.t1
MNVVSTEAESGGLKEADKAVAKANTAQARADTAKTAADTAKTRADAAKAEADAAKTAAANAKKDSKDYAKLQVAAEKKAREAAAVAEQATRKAEEAKIAQEAADALKKAADAQKAADDADALAKSSKKHADDAAAAAAKFGKDSKEASVAEAAARIAGLKAEKAARLREEAKIAKEAADAKGLATKAKADAYNDATQKATAAENNAYGRSTKYFQDHKKQLKGDPGAAGAAGAAGKDGKSAPMWPDKHFKQVLGKMGILGHTTSTLSHDAKADFRRTNWQEQLSDNSPWSQGWMGRAYVSSMYNSVAQCVSFVKHTTAPFHKGEVPTTSNTVEDPDGGSMDTEQFKTTGQVPYETLLQLAPPPLDAEKTTDRSVAPISPVPLRTTSTISRGRFRSAVATTTTSFEDKRESDASVLLSIKEKGAEAAVAAVDRSCARFGEPKSGTWAKAVTTDPLPLLLVDVDVALGGLAQAKEELRSTESRSSRGAPSINLIEAKEENADIPGDGEPATGGKTDNGDVDLEKLSLRYQVDTLSDKLANTESTLQEQLRVERAARNSLEERHMAALEEHEERMAALEHHLGFVQPQQEGTGKYERKEGTSVENNAGKSRLAFMELGARGHLGARLGSGAHARSGMRVRKGGFDFGFSKISGWIEDKINKFSRAVIDPMRKWIEKALADATSFLEGMIKAVTEKLEEAQNWLKGLIEQVKRGLEKVIDGIKKIIDKIKAAMKKAVDWLKGLIDKLKKELMNLVKKLKEAINKAKKWLKSLIEELKNKVMSLVKAIKDELKKAKDWLVGLIDKLKDEIMSVVEKLKKMVKGWVDSVLKFVKDLKDKLLEVVQKVWKEIKKAWKKVEELWEKIKELPALIYGWIQKGISTVIGLVEKVLLFFGDTTEPKKVAGRNCKILKTVIIVWDLCYWFFATVELVGHKVLELATWILEAVLKLMAGTIKAASGGTVNVRFALDNGQAYSVCKSTKTLLQGSVWFNIPWYIMCHVAAHALYGFEDVVDAVLTVVLGIAAKFPDVDGRKAFGASARGGILLSFGDKKEARAACRSFGTMLGGIYPAGFLTIGLAVLCGFAHRFLAFAKSAVDVLSYHARAIAGGKYFDTAEEAQADCSSFKDMSSTASGTPDPAGLLKPLGALAMHAGFVQCTMLQRVPAPFEWLFHTAWDFVQRTVLGGLESSTYAVAKSECAWKHFGLFGLVGVIGEALCRAYNRLIYTGFDMAVMVFHKMLDVVLGAPSAAQKESEEGAAGAAAGTCSKGKAALAAIPVIKEMPLNLLFIPCKAIVRAPHILATPFIRLVQKVFGASSSSSSFVEIGAGAGASRFPDPLPDAKAMASRTCALLRTVP